MGDSGAAVQCGLDALWQRGAGLERDGRQKRVRSGKLTKECGKEDPRRGCSRREKEMNRANSAGNC